MAKDFRELLVEASRHDEFGRVFKEIAVGFKVVVSFQASNVHSSYPEETLDDIYQYSKWEVSLRQVTPAIDVPNVGAWHYLKHNYWAKPFDKPDFQRAMLGEFIPTKHCQQILEDVIEYALLKKQIDSEDDIRTVEPDEELKKSSRCGGCGGKKTAEKPEKAKAE
ncbi:MAG: hypothetical protein JEY79_11910 [Pseudodesulfovibrio sp.]|nr:hypothetical protein [Pseudodesulfovibrio sp.]